MVRRGRAPLVSPITPVPMNPIPDKSPSGRRIKSGVTNELDALAALQVTKTTHQPDRHRSLWIRYLRSLGPGLVTGAADDDPSGIATYSIAGAALGYVPLWTALFSFPLMASVQLMCARIAKVTGRGLAGAVRARYPPWILWGACALLIIANVLNIAADIAAMAESLGMITVTRSAWWMPLFAGLIIVGLFWLSYRRLAGIFKWMTLVLFAYVAAAFLAKVEWSKVLWSTVTPHVEFSGSFLSIFVAILGTTISPYLFFWQAAQEVEEDRAAGRVRRKWKRVPQYEMRRFHTDVISGAAFSNFVMFFIIATTAATLHAHGHKTVATAKEAAEALRPLAGNAAYWLFTFGIIGTGMLGVPILAGSCAYAISEGAAWRGSLDKPPGSARNFYAILLLAVAGGLLLDTLGISAVKMLFWSAVANGVLAPPLLLLVVLMSNDSTVMGKQVNPPILRILGWLTFFVMLIAAILMFMFLE
jgi:NRAMP (natural resistance-associated macrophage protein)-like metal ion transporter